MNGDARQASPHLFSSRDGVGNRDPSKPSVSNCLLDNAASEYQFWHGSQDENPRGVSQQ